MELNRGSMDNWVFLSKGTVSGMGSRIVVKKWATVLEDDDLPKPA